MAQLCKWTDGPCHGTVFLGKSYRPITYHLLEFHGLDTTPSQVQHQTQCHWSGCDARMQLEVLSQHVWTHLLNDELMRETTCRLSKAWLEGILSGA